MVKSIKALGRVIGTDQYPKEFMFNLKKENIFKIMFVSPTVTF